MSVAAGGAGIAAVATRGAGPRRGEDASTEPLGAEPPPRGGFAWGAEPPVAERAERALAATTAAVRGAVARSGAGVDLDAALASVSHEWLELAGERLHLEVHESSPAAPTVVVVHGLGDHARRQLALAAALVGGGLNVVVLDRPGHGLSEGRRGDATLEADLAASELAIAHARARFAGPVVLLGDSLGGIVSWYLLTREPDIEAAVCHCIGHPDVHHHPSFRLKAPALRALARLAPRSLVPVTQVADYEHVALDPETRRYFAERHDPLFNFTVTARAVASYLGFRPSLPWERVELPVLVLIGAEDRMVTPAFTRRSLAAATPPRAELVEVPRAGHQIFLDDLPLVVDRLLAWIREALA